MTRQALDRKGLLQVVGPGGDFFLQFTNDLPIGVIISDASERLVYYNKAQLEMDGLKPGQVLGRQISEIYGTDSGQKSSSMRYCLTFEQPVLNWWKLYDTPARKNIRALGHTFPLYRDGALSGCVALTIRFSDVEVYEQITKPAYKQPADAHQAFRRLAGRSRDFRSAIDLAKIASANPMPVLLYGETGVGKELFAHGIHEASSRKNKPFVPVNCSAIPESLFESLMFGVSRGAFTGAVERCGFFEEADGGTIFLDELDSMPLSLQPKILRVLQEKTVRRLGAAADKRIDVKIISASSSNPLDIVNSGKLRSDLYFRLGGLQIAIPPLRDRLEDLEALVDDIINRHAPVMNSHIRRAGQGLLKLFQAYHWPGNVRELEHVVISAMSLAGTRRQTLSSAQVPEHFKKSIFQAACPPNTGRFGIENEPRPSGGPETEEPHRRRRPPAPGPAAGGLVARSQAHEKDLIIEALAKSFGNVSLAARLMDLSHQTLHYKIKKYGLEVGPFKIDKKQ